ncbi:hypothetical protein [Nocardia sp. NPDC059239]|uniref:hypothetical protein n=1 Tax=Nocardia sp. NPDC059239 TaxID=3346785 RepID=UPI00367750DE
MFRPDTGTAFLASTHQPAPGEGFPVRVVHGDVLRIEGHEFVVWCPPGWVMVPDLRRVDSPA